MQRKDDAITIRYQPTVLIGNWYEQRFSDRSDKHAITPGIYGKSGCINDTSIYKTDYTPFGATAQATEDFLEWKRQGYNHRLYSDSANIRLWDGDEFKNNMTTIHDIMYRIIPQKAMLCHNKDTIVGNGPDIETSSKTAIDKDIYTDVSAGTDKLLMKVKKKPALDLLGSFGNSTKTGFLQWMACEEYKERTTPVYMSHYKYVFTAPPLHLEKRLA